MCTRRASQSASTSLLAGGARGDPTCRTGSPDAGTEPGDLDKRASGHRDNVHVTVALAMGAGGWPKVTRSAPVRVLALAVRV